MTVWYSASHDEIWLRSSRYRIERGCQALIPIPDCELTVPDWLSLYSFELNLKRFKKHLKAGWLVKLGSL